MAAGKGRLWFFPWQWGNEYDATGDGGGLIPLFDEQVEVRNLLRAGGEAKREMGGPLRRYLHELSLEPFLGIVDRQAQNITVRASRNCIIR